MLVVSISVASLPAVGSAAPNWSRPARDAGKLWEFVGPQYLERHVLPGGGPRGLLIRLFRPIIGRQLALWLSPYKLLEQAPPYEVKRGKAQGVAKIGGKGRTFDAVVVRKRPRIVDVLLGDGRAPVIGIYEEKGKGGNAQDQFKLTQKLFAKFPKLVVKDEKGREFRIKTRGFLGLGKTQERPLWIWDANIDDRPGHASVVVGKPFDPTPPKIDSKGRAHNVAVTTVNYDFYAFRKAFMEKKRRAPQVGPKRLRKSRRPWLIRFLFGE